MDVKAALQKMVLPTEVSKILKKEGLKLIIPESRQELIDLSLGGVGNDSYDVEYNVEGKGMVKEAYVTRCKNGIVANYEEAYMRRRDPDSMVIADDLPTDKKTHKERFGKEFEPIRNETLEWLSEQDGLICMPFYSGPEDVGIGYPSLLICPANAAFFALGLADLQGFTVRDNIPNFFHPRAIVYVAPPFRHTHYDGKQVVIHNRLFNLHEVFSYNLYPGPSAKKGIYAVLLDIGEQEKWVTLHASTVKIVTPYELTIVIMHEGASGGGKSEMTEDFHRDADGKLVLGVNTVTKDIELLSIAESCELNPVTDDMAICHPSMQNDSKKLVVADAESGWFLRVDHITEYGTEPHTEKITINPPEELVFLNLDGAPGSTALIWEPIMDSPKVPCSNPRVILPRTFKDRHVDVPVEVDIRSFGFRQPPNTKDKPTYGIVGMFHVLPPSLAWLWRLVAPRGYKNPSILDSSKMNELSSEGVGSYWPFATGKKITQANLLLEQITNTPNTRYVLIPNQFIGAYKVGFAGQWATREYLSRRGGAVFKEEAIVDSRCPLLGHALNSIKFDGQIINKKFLQVDTQLEVGEAAYDEGAKVLSDFFKSEAKQYLEGDLLPLGKKIIEVCLNDGSVSDFVNCTKN